VTAKTKKKRHLNGKGRNETIAITTAIDSKGKIEQWASRDFPVLGSLAWCQQCIDFCWAIKKVLDQRHTLVVVKLLGTRGT
jgi:hypothetical protein